MEDPILQYVEQKGEVTAGELVDNLDIPRSTLFTKIDQLVSQGQLIKIGTRPNVIYKLPSDSDSTLDLPIPESDPADTASVVPPDATAVAHSPSLLYWCKFLHLDPQAVAVSYKQIRELVPNAQSIGMSAPKDKRVGLKIPDPIWVKFFNLITWIVAIGWTILKNGWGLFRKFYKGEIPWGPIVVMCLMAWVILVFILPRFVKPSAQENQPSLVELSNQTSLSKLALGVRLKEANEEIERLKLSLKESKESIVQVRDGSAIQGEKYYKMKDELWQVKKEAERSRYRINDLEQLLSHEKEERLKLEEQNNDLIKEGNVRYEQFQQEKSGLMRKLNESEAKIRQLSRMEGDS